MAPLDKHGAGSKLCIERLDAGFEEEAFLMAGDQEAAEDGASGLGVALLFSSSRQTISNNGEA